jgi:hypothetical protein
MVDRSSLNTQSRLYTSVREYEFYVNSKCRVIHPKTRSQDGWLLSQGLVRIPWEAHLGSVGATPWRVSWHKEVHPNQLKLV